MLSLQSISFNSGDFATDGITVGVANATLEDEFLVREITGLGPPEVDLYMGEYSRDGGVYQGRRTGFRNIVVVMDLNYNAALSGSVMALRDKMYRTFLSPLGNKVDILLEYVDTDTNEALLLVTGGHTERIETGIFTSETAAQISLICPDPYLYSMDPTTVFPNAASIQGLPVIGNADTGFTAEIEIVSTTQKLTLGHEDYYSGWPVMSLVSLSLDVPDPYLVAGTVLTVSTVPGNRYVIKTSDGTSLLNYMTPLSGWPTLGAQGNDLKVYGEDTSDLPAKINVISFKNKFWGV